MHFKKFVYLSPTGKSLESVSLNVAERYELERNRGNVPSLLILDNNTRYVLGLAGARKLEEHLKQTLEKKRFLGVSPRFAFMGGSIRDYLDTLKLRGYSRKELNLANIQSHNILGYSLGNGRK